MPIIVSMHEIHDKRLDLNLLLAFDALYREASVTRAAASLGLTQSAMSHALRRLRDFFADPLFVRAGGLMRPTPKGEQIAQGVRTIMLRIDSDLMSQRRFHPATSERVFNLCMTDLGELTLLPTLVKRFTEAAPNCRIKCFQVPLQEVDGVLETGEADLYLGVLPKPPKHLFQQELFVYTLSAIVSRLNTTVGERVTREQMHEMRHVVVRPSGRRGLSDTFLEYAGIRAEPYLTTPHWLAVPMVLAEDPSLIAFVPRALAMIFDHYGVTRAVKTPVEFKPYPVHQYWHPRFRHDETNMWLRGFVKQSFEGYHEDSIVGGTAPVS